MSGQNEVEKIMYIASVVRTQNNYSFSYSKLTVSFCVSTSLQFVNMPYLIVLLTEWYDIMLFIAFKITNILISYENRFASINLSNIMLEKRQRKRENMKTKWCISLHASKFNQYIFYILKCESDDIM